VSKARTRTLVLRPADPFDLIRWLARSQSDPRKAVAELVQNSIDAAHATLPSSAGGCGAALRSLCGTMTGRVA
jgi:hypothetical protein